ncbi:MAG: hypothetical protein PHO90_03330 [Candidatus Pacebacteria bacterium]|nr:hypothetical protein [Candidatus Paceibacterota bacterium]
MNEEKYNTLKALLIIGIALLSCYSFFRLATYNEKRVEALETSVMKMQEEINQIKIKLYSIQ